jgi:hypothetical protein
MLLSPKSPLSEETVMVSPVFGVSDPSANQTALIAQKLRVEQALKGSSSWFIVIAGLSLVNSVLFMSGAKIHFIFGLGFTQIVDALAHNVGETGVVLDLIINGVIAAVFALFWNFARKGEKWAWVAGMGLYVLDGLILLLFKDFLSVAFHGWALYRMSMGWKLLPVMEKLKQSSTQGTVSSSF